MSYSREIYDKAKAKLDELHRMAIRENEERHRVFAEMNPEYDELDRRIAQTSIQLTRVMLSGQKDITQALDEIRDNNLAMQQRQRDILRENRCPEDFLTPKFTCTKCNDTGYIDGKMCQCFRELLKKTAYEELNRSTPLELCSFESFSVEFYPDEVDSSNLSLRQKMVILKKSCMDYANSFTLNSPNLIFQGGVGLGKTHLSLAIAGNVISKGYGVIYGSAPNFFNSIEAEHFGRNDDKQYTLNLLKSCDLLILDDIGTEFITPFTTATLYDMINTRILTNRPTIISTNLSMEGLKTTYDERIISRLSGNYSRQQFVGNDVRIQLKRKRKLGDN